MNDCTPDPVLLTPGPLTTSAVTRTAMLRDWGSWDGAFNALTATVRRQLLDVVGGAATGAFTRAAPGGPPAPIYLADIPRRAAQAT